MRVWIAVAMAALLAGGCSEKKDPDMAKFETDVTAFMGAHAGLAAAKACHVSSRAVALVKKMQLMPDGADRIAKVVAASPDTAEVVAAANKYESDPEKAAERNFDECIAAAEEKFKLSK